MTTSARPSRRERRDGPRLHGARVVIVALLALPALAAPLRAQQAYVAPPPPPGTPAPQLRYPSWAGQLAVLGGNAFLGGLTAGVIAALRGGSFERAFTYGVMGGAVVYVGKRVAVARFEGAGLAGREVAAAGGSMVENAGVGAGPLQHLRFPIGPVTVDVDAAGGRRRLSARLQLIPLLALAYAIGQPQLGFDARASLSAGTPVFRAHDLLFRARWAHVSRSTGLEMAGTIWLSDVPSYGRVYAERVFAHERVHVLQSDFFSMAWGGPFESWLRRRAGDGPVPRLLGLDLGGVVLAGLSALVPDYGSRPWELEANFLENK